MIFLLLAMLQQDGWTKLQVGYETVEVYRDSHGIPHIFAKTWEAAFWAEGYVEAQDRWNQMNTFRHVARGESAALVGPDGLKNDLDVRLHGYTEAERRKMFDAMSAKFRAIVSAYAAGVNEWLQENKIDARPWSETDCVAIAVAMSRRFGDGGDYELEIQQVYTMLEKKLGAEKARQVLLDAFRETDAAAPTTLHDHEKSREGGFRPGVPMDDYAQFRSFLDEAKASRDRLGWPTYFGSNAWVVAPSRSKSGRPMLYGGPMMGFKTPSICNEIHLEGGGLKVGGMSFPGAPGVMIGFNERLAWTTTSGGADLIDVFSLKLDDQGRYFYQGEWREFEVIEDEIAIKGEAPRKLKIVRSVHGPVVGEKRAHTLRYSFWMREWSTMEGVLDMNFAKDVKEFEAGAKKIVTSHNFFVADRDGNIGFWYCGAHPKRRKGHDPRFPQPGDGTMDWDGLLSTDEWPQSINPKNGFFANWNNKPSRSWEPSAYGKIFWGKKIIDVLESNGKIGFEEFQAIARDTAYHCYLADYFRTYVLEAARVVDPKLAETLEKWDHMSVEGDPRPALYEKWALAMMRRVFGIVFEPILFGNRDLQRYMIDPLIYVLEGDRSLVKLNFDWVAGRDLKKLAQEALTEVLKQKLSWEAPKILDVKSPSGRGTFQMTVEVGTDGPRAETVAPPGQSEKPDSKHHHDQVGLFEAWKYKKFLWKREEMR